MINYKQNETVLIVKYVQSRFNWKLIEEICQASKS